MTTPVTGGPSGIAREPPSRTSEVEIVGGRARGVAVHTAARAASLAGAGDVLVSGTTRDLLDGSDLSLESRGEHEFKGLSGVRPIFAVRR